MFDWNVVVTTRERGWNDALEALSLLAQTSRTAYFNVLVMHSPDPRQLLEILTERLPGDARLNAAISRLSPVTDTFTFQSPEAFESEARRVVGQWEPQLRGHTFHVRMHRRGFKGRLSSQDEERFLDHYLTAITAEAGEPARISFDAPDFVICLETVGQRAGLALWNRDEIARYPVLKLD